FQPGVAVYKNKIGDFVRATSGNQPRPKPQRMRATWLVNRMTAGLPIHELTYEAGVASIAALARFERFLPAVPPPVHERTARVRVAFADRPGCSPSRSTRSC